MNTERADAVEFLPTKDMHSVIRALAVQPWRDTIEFNWMTDFSREKGFKQGWKKEHLLVPHYKEA